MSLHKKIVQRSVYGCSSWLNEIGGYGQTLSVICLLLLPLIQGWSLEKYLVSKLYKMQPEIAKKERPSDGD
jgi:hypothetical protein